MKSTKWTLKVSPESNDFGLSFLGCLIPYIYKSPPFLANTFFFKKKTKKKRSNKFNVI